jgi:hypothetical protein
VTGVHWLCKVRHSVGHRGAALLGFGIFDLVYGWTKMIHPDPISAQSQQMRLLGDLFPWWPSHITIMGWGYLWWVVGAMCIANAFRRDDRWGYGAAIGIKVSWIVANVWAWSQGLIGGGATVATWGFVLYVTMILAIRPEADPQLDQWLDQHTGEIPRIRPENEGGEHP